MISTIVIPAAGFGTRFLPVTKSMPKELLPLLNKPAIQAIIEEGMQAGVFDFSIVISKEKQAIKDYFSPAPALEQTLSKCGKQHLLADINNILKRCTFSFPLQKTMKGFADAVLMARAHIKDHFFGVMLPDDFIISPTPCMGQLMEVAARNPDTAIIGVMEVPWQEISSYGSIKKGTLFASDLIEIVDIIEKPTPEQAFSNLAIIGRYILPTTIFDAINAIAPAASGEIQMTDAITHLIKQGHRVLAYIIKGTRFDLGRPAGWLAANNFLNKNLTHSF